MKSMLVTGGTVFVSRYIAEYFLAKHYDVHVLNRNRQEQSKGVKLIEADRHHLGDILRDFHFDVIIDTAYDSKDVEKLVEALGGFEEYILISSGAVYPQHSFQPIKEDTPLEITEYMDTYGKDKMQAELALLTIHPNAYILRPSYLYGPMNNIYREAFIFDCALANKKCYIPNNGEMNLQFFHIHDLCRFIDIILTKNPAQHIFNLGNKNMISIREWVKLCYHVAGNKNVEFVSVSEDIEQSNYFCFSNYEYCLDTMKQYELMQENKPLYEGLKDAFAWYQNNKEKVRKKDYINYIDHIIL